MDLQYEPRFPGLIQTNAPEMPPLPKTSPNISVHIRRPGTCDEYPLIHKPLARTLGDGDPDLILGIPGPMPGPGETLALA